LGWVLDITSRCVRCDPVKFQDLLVDDVYVFRFSALSFYGLKVYLKARGV